MFVNQSKSKTFHLSTKIFLQFNKWTDHEMESKIYKTLIFPLRSIYFLMDYVKYFFLKLKLFKSLRNSIQNKKKPNSFLEKKISEYNPDLIVLPTKAIDNYYFDLNKIALKLNIKLIYLVDNWDNISGKSIVFKNHYYGVWGKQSLQQVKKIHGVSLKKIRIVGSPRFEVYFQQKNAKIKSHYSFKYILFLENTYCKESISLKYLDKIINNNKIFNKFKIVYRPHPWRKSREIIKARDYKNVVIDKQLRKTYDKKFFLDKSQPDLKYYPSLISNAQLVISGPTTMVIESLLLKKKILLLAFKESNSFYSPHYMLKYLEHFKGINKFKNLVINKNLNSLEKDLIKTYLKKKNDFNYIDTKRNFYLFRGKKEYNLVLSDIVKDILLEKNV